MLRALNEQNWDTSRIEPTIDSILPSSDIAAHHVTPSPCHLVTEVLHFACSELVPKLRRGAHDEIAHTLAALAGRFVPPGPSGAPTRGMAHVLPTGRNFYAVDPRALPSMAAWQTGQALAETLIERYRREHGDFPGSVGISIWGTSAIRTAGDDIAQVLALLGVRPRWQEANRRVVGVELIPPAELGRPRIDVVCRISGFFRDAFPHLVALLDDAVRTAIAADEPAEQNFPRRHALETAASLRAEGRDDAERQAGYRIFGCAPGSYGAGILPLIDAQNWRTDADLAEVYLSWGGYAYTGAEAAVPARDAFARALSGVQVATKNQDNREHDIFDSDDYLQFHGGMIATIRALTGRNPARYMGDSSDPARPRTRDLREEARRVFRSRVANPKWIDSMKRHGYKGALELAATVDYLFGYDATAEVLDDWMYHDVADAYLRDEELQQFFAELEPVGLAGDRRASAGSDRPRYVAGSRSTRPGVARSRQVTRPGRAARTKQPMSNNDWYRFYAPRRLAELTPELMAEHRAAAERDLDAVLARTGLCSLDRVLEIGCGWGRHSLALAGRGFTRVRSIDIAPEPLATARALAAEHGLDCRFRQQDFLSVDDGPYDAVLSLYDRSICGFPSEAEDARSLRRLADLLRPGGRLVFGINDWPFELPCARRDWREAGDGVELLEVLPDRAAMTCTDRVTLLRADGRRECYELTRRHYYLPELCRLLDAAGFTLEAAVRRLVGDEPYGDGDGLFVYARR